MAPSYPASYPISGPTSYAQAPALLGSASASQYGDGPAPPGFHWDFVIDDLTGARVSDDVTGQPVVDLVGN